MAKQEQKAPRQPENMPPGVRLLRVLRKSLPALFGPAVHIDFCEELTHFAGLFELILAIHKIPLDRPQVEEFRAMLTPEKGLSTGV
jgi:hypothetical protein